MRKLIISGYIGADAQIADLPSGTQVINFNVAVSEKIKDSQEYKTTWFRCARFANNVSIAPYLKKGTYVIVEGKPDIETYVDQQGVTKANLKCIVSEIHFGGSSKNEESTNAPLLKLRLKNILKLINQIVLWIVQMTRMDFLFRIFK